MTSSISFMTRMLSKFRKPEPAPKQDYSWMSEEQVEWQNVRAIEMEMFDADAKPGQQDDFPPSSLTRAGDRSVKWAD